MKYFLTFAFLLALFLKASPLLAQPKHIVFEQDSAYLGHIAMKPALEHRFNFKVMPGYEATIDAVVPDCACTVATYPTETMRDGFFGYIMVAFEPYKAGPFEKRFVIEWKDEEETTELVIKGYIEPEMLKAHVDFPHQLGPFKVRNKMVALGSITNEGVVKKKVEFLNTTNAGVVIGDSLKMPKYIEFVIDSPKVILPNTIGTATVFFHPEIKDDFGYSLDNIRISTTAPGHPFIDLNVASIVKPGASNTPAAQPQIATVANALPASPQPELWVSESEINLGKVMHNQAFIVGFTLYNRGESDLFIKNVVTGPDCSLEENAPMAIAAGQYAILRLRVHAVNAFRGQISRTLTLYTNDPKEPIKQLSVIGELKQ